MSAKSRIGAKIRRLRRSRGLTQRRMAEELGISQSLLNYIENNRRALTVPLLFKLAQTYDLDVASLAEDDDTRLVGDLTEVFGDTLFGGEQPAESEIEALADHAPEIGSAVLTLYRAYRTALDEREALALRLADGGQLLEGRSNPFPSEEVHEFVEEHDNHFPALEAAAEDLGLDVLAGPGSLEDALSERLAQRHGVTVEVVPQDRTPDTVRRFEPQERHLLLSEVLPPRARHFQLAHQIGLLEHANLFDDYIERARRRTPESVALCRVVLANYFAGAVLMPYGSFLGAARELRYDIEMLGHRFRTSFEQICHRLTTLKRPGEVGVPFHMVRVDIAGNLSKRFSGGGIRFARFGGACPRWNVHAAFLQPGFIRTQLSRMPDGTAFFCVARTVRKEGGGFRSPQSRLAIGLGCAVEHARELVYADGIDLENLDAAEPIGPTCRLCERTDCRQRAFPPIHTQLSVDENVRGLSFYSSPPPTEKESD
ncbi:MAG: short-chain fatty acyl-CoA regulator family protein [Planctomycetota bacterium]|nr:short-chain fatty acyl-CoA regulator family protein [Planctomycetota bacterium]